MQFKNIIIIAALIAISFASCDEGTIGLDTSVLPSTDELHVTTQDYQVTTKSVESGAVLARTSLMYLGRFTDPETNASMTADFITQFHCLSGFELPEKMVDTTASKVELRLYFENYIGDSINSCEICVYPLNVSLDNNADYYTDIDPTKYYDESQEPIARKMFTIKDYLVSDSIRALSSYNQHINIRLPEDIGTKILKDYYKHPENFANSKVFSEKECKGVYVKFRRGDGTIVCIDAAQFNIYFNYYDKSSAGYDSIVSGVTSFASTEEIIQATKFTNGDLKELIEDESCTYIKSPAGIFTEATLPVDELSDNDTINSAKIIFNRYNNTTNTSAVGIPQRLMMIRKNHVNKFFENEELNDSVSSYMATYNSTYNSYTFPNIAGMLSAIKAEKKAGIEKFGEQVWLAANPEWNKVVLIPVSVVNDGNGNTVAIHNDFSLSSTKLVGGKNDKITMKVLYSTFVK